MRKVTFRGVNKNGVMIHGNLHIDENAHDSSKNLYYIIRKCFVPALTMPASNYIEVNPETVGQCTGKTYKDGTSVYEGDLITCKSYPFYGIAPHIDGYEGECKELNYVGEVYYSNEECAFFVELKVVSDRVSGRAIGSMLSEYEDIEKYGTIHEHLHLLTQ